MIVYDLACGSGHVFEAWFGDSGDYDDQKKRRLLICPICANSHIDKAPMAPHVAAKSNSRPQATAPGAAKTPMATPSHSKEMMALLGEMQRHVEENFDYVGDRFAEEARAIHDGEAQQRGIYGEATLAEGKALHEDGIPVLPMPIPAKPRRSDA